MDNYVYRSSPWARLKRRLSKKEPAANRQSFRKIHRGDENNPGTPSPLYGHCHQLFPRAAFWFTHHVKKPPATWLMQKEQYDPGEDPNVYRGTTAWLDDADAAIYLHKDAKGRTLRVPRAVVWGADDTVDSLASGRATAASLGVRLTLVAHAGHLSMLAQPRSVAAAIGRAAEAAR